MNVEEYATMFSVEDGHWCYLGLRGMIDLFWRRCVTASVTVLPFAAAAFDVAVHTDRRFTKGELLRLLRECDFEPLHATYWNTLLFPPVVATRLWRRMFPPKGSDLDTDWEGASNRVFAAILGLERGLARVAPLPFGLSVFAVARKA